MNFFLRFLDHFAFAIKFHIFMYAVLALIPLGFMLLWNHFFPGMELDYLKSAFICFVFAIVIS